MTLPYRPQDHDDDLIDLLESENEGAHDVEHLPQGRIQEAGLGSQQHGPSSPTPSTTFSPSP